MLIIERGEELNTVLSAQGWEAGSLGTGLKITDVGSSICSSSLKFDDSEEASELAPATSALCMVGRRWNQHHHDIRQVLYSIKCNASLEPMFTSFKFPSP